MTLLLIALGVIFSVHVLEAQCPTIKNDMACNIGVKYTLLDCNNNPCWTSPVTTIPAFTNLTTNCTMCSPVCNIVVTLVSVNGAAIAPVTANYGVGSPGNSFPTPVPCGTGSSGNIWFDSSIGAAGEFVIK